MNKVVTVVLSSLAGLFLVLLIACGVSYITANDYGSTVESSLRASRDNNKNILAQYEQKIFESVQVPEMYKKDFAEVIKSDVEGRYGKAGSTATMQWIKERELPFDSGLYKKIQQLIESGRKDFEAGQTKMIDIRRGYETQQGYFWRGFWLRAAGFPKVNMADYQPVITGRVESTFATGKEAGPLKLR